MQTKTETSAGGIVFKKPQITNNKSQTLWLITQHSQNKSWGFPKGLIGDHEENESMETAALREVQEEGGVKTKIVIEKPITVTYSYQWKGSPHAKGSEETMLVHKTVHYYLMEYIAGDPKDHDWEMMDAKFVSGDEVKKILTYKSDLEAFEKVLALMQLQK